LLSEKRENASANCLYEIDVDIQANSQVQHELNGNDREGNGNATNPGKSEEKH